MCIYIYCKIDIHVFQHPPYFTVELMACGPGTVAVIPLFPLAPVRFCAWAFPALRNASSYP